jgi:hypothetical protein
MSSHINDLRSYQTTCISQVVDANDAKDMLLNNLLFKYSTAIFTQSQLPSQSLDEMIASIASE